MGIDEHNHLKSLYLKGNKNWGSSVERSSFAHRAVDLPILPKKDPHSTVSTQKIGETCASCHAGILEKFNTSIHSPVMTKTDKKLPVCNDCHSSHSISRHDISDFRLNIAEQCGKCHEKSTETYFMTYHGKASKLGTAGTAKCSDCHGAHAILATADPKSTLHKDNIIGTCGNCHEGSNANFAGFMPHATHDDKEKYPILFYSFWAMVILLIGTFAFFGIHTSLWLTREIIEKSKHRRLKAD